MDIEISPEPGEDERRAILAALAEDDQEREPGSAWRAALLSDRGEDPLLP